MVSSKSGKNKSKPNNDLGMDRVLLIVEKYLKLFVFLDLIIMDLVCGIIYDNTGIVGFKTAILVHGGIGLLLLFFGILGWFLTIIGIITPTQHVGTAHVRSGSTSARIDVYGYDNNPGSTFSLSTKIVLWGIVGFISWIIGMIIVLKIGITL